MTKKRMKKVLDLARLAMDHKDKVMDSLKRALQERDRNLDEADEKNDSLIKAGDRLHVALRAHHDIVADLKAEIARQEDVIYDLRTDKYEKELKPLG